jgi:hypothetical protein
VLRAARVGGGPPLFYDHCHPTPRGNVLIARAIDDFLVESVVPTARTARSDSPNEPARF